MAMVDHKVVLRLKDGRTVEGRLASANESGFVIEKADGTSESVPRAAAKGVRLAEAGSAGSSARRAASMSSAALASDPDLAPGGEPPSSDVAEPEGFLGRRHRVFGFGTAFGGGFAAASTLSGSSTHVVSPAFLLPTLELQAFLPREYSIDLVVPVASMILSSAVLGGTVVNMDAYFNANIGDGKMRCVIGPGIGFSYLDIHGQSAASVRFPAQLGFEALSKSRGFGFKLLARPWAEVASGSSASAVGGGLLGVLVFSGYATSAD
jgi:hypothetical protein